MEADKEKDSAGEEEEEDKEEDDNLGDERLNRVWGRTFSMFIMIHVL